MQNGSFLDVKYILDITAESAGYIPTLQGIDFTASSMIAVWATSHLVFHTVHTSTVVSAICEDETESVYLWKGRVRVVTRHRPKTIRILWAN